MTLSLLPLTPPPPSLRVTSLKSDKVVFRRPPPSRKSDKSCDIRWISGEYTKKEIKLGPSIFSWIHLFRCVSISRTRPVTQSVSHKRWKFSQYQRQPCQNITQVLVLQINSILTKILGISCNYITIHYRISQINLVHIAQKFHKFLMHLTYI